MKSDADDGDPINWFYQQIQLRNHTIEQNIKHLKQAGVSWAKLKLNKQVQLKLYSTNCLGEWVVSVQGG